MIKQERLRHQVQLQSMQIEELFSRHNIAARVVGGRVRRQGVSFDLQTELGHGLERLRELKDDLVMALGVPEVYIDRQNGRWRLEVRQGKVHPVDLLDLMTTVADAPPVTAVLGLSPAEDEDEEPQPVLLDLLAPDMNHILVAGGPGSGKTALLRAMALSLALNSRQSELQLLIVDPAPAIARHNQSKLLRPLTYLPHLLAPVVHTLDEIMDVCNFLVEEIAYRRQQQLQSPAIVLFVDELIDLLAAGGRPLAEAVTVLLQQGPAAGVRLVLSVRQVTSPLLTRLMKAHISIRLVGQTVDAVEAAAASGVSSAHAEYLMGKGDFLAISYTSLIRFQAAYLADSDLHLVLTRLHRQRAPALLAQPCDTRPTMPENSPAEADFHFDSDRRQARFDD